MEHQPEIKLYACTLDCAEPHELAQFYAALLGWIIPYHDDTYAVVAPPGVGQGAYPGIQMQRNPVYLPPVWPEEPEKQQQMAHLDFAVNDLRQAVRHAISCGATVAGRQFSEGWTVMFDPAGHPFCLCGMPHIFESPDYALR